MSEKEIIASTKIIYFIYLPFCYLAGAFFIFFYYLSFGLENLKTTSEIIFNPLVLIGVIVIPVFIHEFLHALAFSIFNKKPFSSTKFGFTFKGLFPYAHHKEPMTVNVLRISLLFPTIFLGLLPIILAFVFQNAAFLIFGALNVSFGAGDFAYFMKTIKLKSNFLIKDHPSRPGFSIVKK